MLQSRPRQRNISELQTQPDLHRPLEWGEMTQIKHTQILASRLGKTSHTRTKHTQNLCPLTGDDSRLAYSNRGSVQFLVGKHRRATSDAAYRESAKGPFRALQDQKKADLGRLLL